MAWTQGFHDALDGKLRNPPAKGWFKRVLYLWGYGQGLMSREMDEAIESAAEERTKP